MKAILLSIACVFLMASCAPPRPPIDIPTHAPTPRKISKQLDVAIALGSGGAKGYAHVGVLEVLVNAGVPIDLLSGASAGSIVAALFSDHGSIAQTYQAMMSADLWSFADIDTPNRMGFVSGYSLENYIYTHVDAKVFKDLKIPLLIATTDLQTGASYTIASGPIAPAVDASASLPGLVIPTSLYGKILIDGGVSEPIPVAQLEVYAPKLIIAVDISSSLAKQLPTKALGVYHRAYDIMWIHQSKDSRRRADIVIHPHIPADIGTFSIKKKCQIYEAGKEAAKQALPEVLAALKQRGIGLIKPDQPAPSSEAFCHTE